MHREAFLSPAPVAHSVNINTSSSIAVSKRPPLQLQHRKPHRTRCVHHCLRACAASNRNSEGGSGRGGGDDDGDELTRKVSGTFVGRILIEVGAFIAGVTLLVVVAFWKACTVIASYLWRALLWLAHVRRLGRWACARAYGIGVEVWRSPGRYGAPALRRIGDMFSGLAARFRDADVHVPVTEVRRVDEHALEVQHMREELVRMREIIERQGATKQSQAEPAPASASPPPTPVPPLPRHRLILLRHAKSDFDRSGKTADHERALSPAGVNEAALVGAELARRGWHYDSVLCSNARRTTETLDRIGASGDDANTSSDVVVTESLYFAVSGEEMATVVDGEMPDGKCRLVVAHSPGINQLVERLTGVATVMGTACAALLEFRGETSSLPDNLVTANGMWTLVDVVCPKQLLQD